MLILRLNWTESALLGLAAGLGGAAFTLAVRLTVDRFAYHPTLLTAGFISLVAAACLFLLASAVYSLARSASVSNYPGPVARMAMPH
jgi:hypothetical protein